MSLMSVKVSSRSQGQGLHKYHVLQVGERTFNIIHDASSIENMVITPEILYIREKKTQKKGYMRGAHWYPLITETFLKLKRTHSSLEHA